MTVKAYHLITKEIGRPVYHPEFLLKALLSAYYNRTFSGRDIKKMIRENLEMQRLNAQTIISYRTNNRFRVSHPAKRIIRDLYISFSAQLKKEKLISMRRSCE